ncbi:sulfotransferase family protein [Parafrankia discariae]|uniref:sulfotransferase family protein n=1 Tax=Parafrankia discariae TaxID=365528 RepID=UPI000382E5D7|nr:sulfotransferase family protein [Parafrankia discariae]
MAGSAGRRDVPDVVGEVVGRVSHDARWWGARPVVPASVVDDALAEAISDQVPGAWVVRVLPADLPLREAVDEALREAGPAAPDTRRYDDLTAALRQPTGPGGDGDLLDRRRTAARRERWKYVVEPVGLLWIGVASLGAALMSAANVKQFGRGDLAWNVGTFLLFTAILLIGTRLLAGLWRLVRGSIRAAPTERELARALLRDLRYDARRIVPTGWFRARDVPRRLPVLLVATAGDGRRPVLLEEYLRWHSPRLPRWLWWLTAALRRPSAVVVTDHPMPVTAGVWLRAAWRRRAEHHARLRTCLRTSRRTLRGLPAGLAAWWGGLPGPAWRRLGAVARAVLLPPGEGLVRLVRWLVVFLWPRRARARMRRLTAYGLAAVLAGTAVYVQLSPGQPYCLRPMAGSERDLSTDTSAGEWIGYRTCLGWRQLAGNVVGETLSSVAARLTVHRPGPDDVSDLFDDTLIYRENKRVERLADHRRPIVTVALVSSLTSAAPTRAVRSVVAEREGLAGAYAAQLRINAMRGTSLPYVRLAVVNSGDLTAGMSDLTVRDHLKILEGKLRQLAEDPTLAAAVVTGNSTTGLRDVLGASLGAAGVPMISPTMSADGFGANLASPATDPDGPGVNADGLGAATRRQPMFFQINSTNDDQVQLIYEYARGQGSPLTFFYPVTDTTRTGPDADDLYLTSLYCDVLRRQQHPEPAQATGSAQATESGQDPAGGPPSTCAPPSQATERALSAASSASVLSEPVLSDGEPGPTAPPVPVSLVPWSPGRSLTTTASQACPPANTDTQPAVGQTPAGTGSTGRMPGAAQAAPRTPGATLPLVFFGGRYTDVAEFTQALRLACGSRMPQVAVADSSARFLADRELARHVPHGVQVLIAYRGRIQTCAGLGDPQAGADESLFDAGRRTDFYGDIRAYLGRCGGPGSREQDRWLSGGWASLSYDSLLMVNDALLRAGMPSTAADARHQILRCLRGPTAGLCDSTDYPGAYGTIHLDDQGVGRRSAVLLHLKDLTTAFGSPSEVSTVGTCAPVATPCLAHITPEARNQPAEPSRPTDS